MRQGNADDMAIEKTLGLSGEATETLKGINSRMPHLASALDDLLCDKQLVKTLSDISAYRKVRESTESLLAPIDTDTEELVPELRVSYSKRKKSDLTTRQWAQLRDANKPKDPRQIKPSEREQDESTVATHLNHTLELYTPEDLPALLLTKIQTRGSKWLESVATKDFKIKEGDTNAETKE